MRGGGLKVNVITLDDFVFGHQNPAPSVIKMDIEGGENLALIGGRKVLEEFHPVIFLAAHGYKKRDECRDFLISLGYRLEILVSDKESGDYELLATQDILNKMPGIFL